MFAFFIQIKLLPHFNHEDLNNSVNCSLDKSPEGTACCEPRLGPWEAWQAGPQEAVCPGGSQQGLSLSLRRAFARLGCSGLSVAP